jgi:hypothetical protein
MTDELQNNVLGSIVEQCRPHRVDVFDQNWPGCSPLHARECPDCVLARHRAKASLGVIEGGSRTTPSAIAEPPSLQSGWQGRRVQSLIEPIHEHGIEVIHGDGKASTPPSSGLVGTSVTPLDPDPTGPKSLTAATAAGQPGQQIAVPRAIAEDPLWIREQGSDPLTLTAGQDRLPGTPPHHLAVIRTPACQTGVAEDVVQRWSLPESFPGARDPPGVEVHADTAQRIAAEQSPCRFADHLGFTRLDS